MRALVPLLLMAACPACRPANPDQDTPVDRATGRAAVGANTVPCAGAGAALESVCTVEQSEGPNGSVLTLRHPDGAFRRLLIATDGRGVIAADGAEPALVEVKRPDRILVTIAGERYELPATIGNASK